MHIDTLKTITEIVAASSALHTILPPWEAFDDFPTLQKYYKLFVYIVGYAGLNGRSTVYSKQISVNSSTSVNANNPTSKSVDKTETGGS
jgi:hypothetical protein